MSSFTIKTNPSVKELKIWLLKISFGVVFVVFGIFGVFSDAFAVFEGFESYDVGTHLIPDVPYWVDITAPDDWAEVKSSPVKTGSRSASLNEPLYGPNYGVYYYFLEEETLAVGTFSVWFRNDFTGSGDGIALTLSNVSENAKAAQLNIGYPTADHGQIKYRSGVSYFVLGTYAGNTWFNLQAEWEIDEAETTGVVRYQLDSEGWTDWVDTPNSGRFEPDALRFSYARWLNLKHWYIDDIEIAGVCSADNCSGCEEWFECQVVGCCWFYQPWYPPPLDNYCDVCEGECSYPLNCGLCATETTCEATGCFWTGDYCTQFEWECGGELACQFCATQETCEAEDCNWNELSGTCWYAAPTLPSSWSTYYDTHGGYETPSEFVNQLAQTTGETLAVVSGLFEGFLTSFNTADALAKGSALGNVIPKGRGYLKVFDGLFGHYPIGETFVFILIFMLAVGLFRIVRQLIALIKP